MATLSWLVRTVRTGEKVSRTIGVQTHQQRMLPSQRGIPRKEGQDKSIEEDTEHR